MGLKIREISLRRKHIVFESIGLNGPGLAYGVQEKCGGIVYEAVFEKCIFASNVATFSHESCHPSRSKIATPEFPLKTPCRT